MLLTNRNEVRFGAALPIGICTGLTPMGECNE